MKTVYKHGNELNEKILKGVNTLADYVAATYGPRGRNVILSQKDKRPLITKDGVTVASFVELEDPFENVGAQVIKQAAQVTNSNAGDGTTTSTVLARAILTHAQRHLAAGASPIEMRRGIYKAVAKISENITEMATPISSFEEIANIATISANGDTMIGKIIAKAIDSVGKDGAISIEEGRSIDTTLEVVEGFQFDSGYISTEFITDERRGALVYNDALFLVTDYAIDNLDDLLPILEQVSRESRPLVIVAEEVKGQALAALIMNTMRGSMRVAAIKAPRFGEERRNILDDLSLSTGATFVTRSAGLRLADVKLQHLGEAKKIDSLRNWTTVVGGKGDFAEVDKRIETLKVQLKQTDDLMECERIQERITKLASGVAIIRVGGTTAIDMNERKHRIEDALEAVKSAQTEGVVPGGGVALLRAASNITIEAENEDQELGAEIVRAASVEPVRQMAVNAGRSADLVVDQVLTAQGSTGYNFVNDTMVDMYSEGIIDPAKVTRTALQNAASAAATLMTSGHAIVEAS